jgi:hypothetical protein
MISFVMYALLRHLLLQSGNSVVIPTTGCGRAITGDFSVFRVYADKDNRPANYSSENVPYQPKYVVPVSLDGVTDGDYAMTIGYPGSTQRNMSSWGIRQRMESENKPRIEVRGAKQDIWWDAMTKNDTIRINMPINMPAAPITGRTPWE